MGDDSTLLRVRTAWKENDFVTVDSLMTDLEENIANNQWREIPDSIINIWIRSLYREANYEKCISLCKDSLIDNPLSVSQYFGLLRDGVLPISIVTISSNFRVLHIIRVL